MADTMVSWITEKYKNAYGLEAKFYLKIFFNAPRKCRHFFINIREKSEFVGVGNVHGVLKS